jgi:hypothetical protein
MKPRAKDEAVQIDELPWKPFPDAFSQGGIRWKLLHVSPEVGAWTAMLDCVRTVICGRLPPDGRRARPPPD